MKTPAKVVLWMAVLLGMACALALLFMPFIIRSNGVDQAAACHNNLRQIEGAIEQWAWDHQKPPGAPVSTNDILPYLHGSLPQCPAHGQYLFARAGDVPRCSLTVSEHKIVH